MNFILSVMYGQQPRYYHHLESANQSLIVFWI